MIIYTIVGVLFVTTLSIAGIAMAINFIIETIKERKCLQFEGYMKANLHEIERYCDYEFRQVGFLCRTLLEAIENGWRGINANDFREKLREKEKGAKTL